MLQKFRTWTNAHKLQTLLATAFAGGLLALIFYSPWPSESSDYAAWAQAVGSVGAILIAVAVAQHQAEESRRAALRRMHDVRSAGVTFMETHRAAMTTAANELDNMTLPPTSVLKLAQKHLEGFPLIDLDDPILAKYIVSGQMNLAGALDIIAAAEAKSLTVMEASRQMNVLREDARLETQEYAMRAASMGIFAT